MAYDEQTWQNYPSLATPITAERLNHMEAGVYGIAVEVDSLSETVASIYGSSILLGHGVPSDALGNHTDFYIDEDTSNYYQKGVSTWGAAKGNLAGPVNVLSIGTVTTGSPGGFASATITGTAPSQTLNLTIPRGSTGDAGPANTLSMGTVTTGAPGSTASANITGTAPSQTLNLTIPRGDVGATGGAGPANSLAIGTVNTGIAGSSASATITGTAPSQTLNLTIPRGDAGATGGTGPANSLAIGTVTTGTAGSSASATITGTAPSQTLNLTIPRGDAGATGGSGGTGPTGPANSLAIGTVTTGAAGSAASATITGTAPSQTLNLTIPQGNAGTNGTNGTNGSNGSAGAAGARWYTYTGTGAPSNGTGADNDYILNLTTGDVFGPKASGAWPGSAAGNLVPTVIQLNSQSGSYTAVLADAGKIIESTSATGVTFTIPNGVFAVNTILQFRAYGAGQVTVGFAGGVTVRTPSSYTTRTQYSTISAHQRATNEWVLGGDLT